MTNDRTVDAVVPADPRPLTARLEEQRLPPTQRRVARYLATHPDDAALLTSTALAQRIGVSQPTISRVAVALGYEGFAHLQESLRDQLYRSSDLVEWRPAVESAIANLETLNRLAVQQGPIHQAAHLLSASVPLPLVALRIAAPLGHYLGYQLERCHPDVRIISHGDSMAADMLATARTAGATAMVCIMLPRYPTETLNLVRLAHRLGFLIVMIADHMVPPGAEYAQVVLPAPVGSGLVFDTHVAPLLLSSLLVDAVADQLGPGSQDRLEAVETLTAELGTFVE